MTLAALLEDRARTHGDRTFLFWNSQEISYREFADHTVRAAAALAGQGIRPGEAVGIMMANSPAFLYALFGCWRAGAIACPINPALTHEEAGYILSNARIKALVADSVRNLSIATVDLSRESGSPPPCPQDPSALASLIYTSGTTGHPKGVMLTHANYLWNAEAAVQAVGLHTEDRFLCILPLFHVNAQVVTTLGPLMAGAQTVLLPKFAPETFLADVARYRCTAFSAVPTVYAVLLARAQASGLDLSSLRFGLCGAAPMPVEVFEQFEARFGIHILEGYGLSEGTCVSSVNPCDGVRKVGSIGVPIQGQAMRIVDDTGTPVSNGTVGEIVVSGPNVMVGYFDDEVASRAVLKDGWLHTGDLGVRDDDGYFTIVGRKKDMIIRGGENIYPKEVEEVLHRQPGVSEAAVVGLPDAIWGEQVAAVIVAAPQVTLCEDDVLAWCEAHLAPYKRPVRVFLVAASTLPRTATGKVQKGRLRQALLQEAVDDR